MALPVTEFGAGNNVDLLFGIRFKICIANVSGFDLETIEFGEEHAESQRSECDDSRIDTVLGRSSHMAPSNESRFSSKVMLHVENKVYPDEQVVSRRWSSSASVVESIVLTELVHFKLKRVLPFCVAIGLIDLDGVLTASGQEDTKLVAWAMSFAFEFVLLLHPGELDSPRSNSFQRFPARDIEEIIILSIFGASDWVCFCHD